MTGIASGPWKAYTIISKLPTVTSKQFKTSASSKRWWSTNVTFHDQLKLIERLRATRWTPPDYWQTDNSNGLVMVIRNNWLNSASRVLISTCSAPLVQTGEQFFTVWPWPLTYDPDLQSQASQGQGRPSCQRSNGSNRTATTDKQTDTTKRIISPATRSIITDSSSLIFFTFSMKKNF